MLTVCFKWLVFFFYLTTVIVTHKVCFQALTTCTKMFSWPKPLWLTSPLSTFAHFHWPLHNASPDLTILGRHASHPGIVGMFIDRKNRSHYIISILMHSLLTFFILLYSFVLLGCNIGYIFRVFQYFFISTFPGLSFLTFYIVSCIRLN